MISHLLTVVVLSFALGAAAQDAAPSGSQSGPPGDRQSRRGPWSGMGEGRGVMGTVTEVTGDHYTIKTEAGEIYAVHFSANTRIVKAPDRRRGQQDGEAGPATPPQPLKSTDIKVGDAITAGGEVDANAKSVGAVFVALIDPERARQMREMAANFGKTWLMGKVTAIDGVKVTLQGGPGNAAHSFVADENTTFRKRREPITLGDIQVGDGVRVEGAIKDGGFTATAVVVMGQPPAGAPSGQPRPSGQPE